VPGAQIERRGEAGEGVLGGKNSPAALFFRWPQASACGVIAAG
jgi:hypothetical protein